MNESKPGPLVLNQIVTARTAFGHIARCGCGWRVICETSIAALVSGQRHLKDEHSDSTSIPGQEGSAA